MKVVMIMRDTEYRDAMIDMMSDFDKDIFIEIAGDGKLHRDSVIITDIMPSEIESGSLKGIRDRTLFLSAVSPGENADTDGCRVIFKYSSLVTIMAEVTLVYSRWTGNTGVVSPSTRIIAVACETDQYSGARCRSLAGQIIYRHGGPILVLPLGYINDYRCYQDADDGSWFRRLMYMIDEGRDYPADSFTFTDSYGISYLRLADGINPLTGLSRDYITRLIRSIAGHYDTLILDIGTCYSEINLVLLTMADNVLFFGTGSRIGDPKAFLGSGRDFRIISSLDAQAETREIDDFVSEIYGRTD